jgi:SAM-dependent methyltransferase
MCGGKQVWFEPNTKNETLNAAADGRRSSMGWRKKQIAFGLDHPNVMDDKCVQSPLLVSGWVIPPAHAQTVGIEVDVNGVLRARLTTGLQRPDVEKVFKTAEARWSGFGGEVFLDDFDGQVVEVTVHAVFDATKTKLSKFQTRISGLVRQQSPRQRSWQFKDVLACPLCLGSLSETLAGLHCGVCKREFAVRRGTPVFVADSELIESQLLETNPTNPNAEYHTRIIESNSLVLDLGAGNPAVPDQHPNVIFHESVHYANTDVVSLCDRLPYRDETFDAVISKATFEHVRRPWELSDEIYRVLRPGGTVYVETAFMQPLHGNHYHFFNMTLYGVQEIFKRFTEVRSGVQSYQCPIFGFRMQIDALIRHVHSDVWIERLQKLRKSLSHDLDNSLDAKGLQSVAAGFYFEGVKPAQ